MRKLKHVLLVIAILFVSLLYSQEYKEIKVSFSKGKKEMKNVKYYLLKANTVHLIEQKDNKIKLNVKAIKNNEEIKLLAVYDNCKVEFFVKPKKMYYLKINKVPFSFKYFLKRIYVINQGFDSEELVKQSKKKYNFVEL